jgi:hypothetical protein
VDPHPASQNDVYPDPASQNEVGQDPASETMWIHADPDSQQWKTTYPTCQVPGQEATSGAGVSSPRHRYHLINKKNHQIPSFTYNIVISVLGIQVNWIRVRNHIQSQKLEINKIYRKIWFKKIGMYFCSGLHERQIDITAAGDIVLFFIF